jgi:hypothetical protein
MVPCTETQMVPQEGDSDGDCDAPRKATETGWVTVAILIGTGQNGRRSHGVPTETHGATEGDSTAHRGQKPRKATETANRRRS